MIVSAGTFQGYSQVHSGTKVQKGRLSGAVLTQLGLDLEGQHDPPQDVGPRPGFRSGLFHWLLLPKFQLKQFNHHLPTCKWVIIATSQT